MSVLRFIIFLTVMVVGLGAINWAVYRRLTNAVSHARWFRRTVAGVLLAGLVAMIAGRALGGVVPPTIAVGLGVMGGIVQIAAIIAFVLLGLERLVFDGGGWIATRIFRRATTPEKARETAHETSPETAPDAAREAVPETALENRAEEARDSSPAGAMSRRGFVRRVAVGSAVAVAGGSSLYAGLFGRHDYVIEEVPVRLARLPRQLDGFTLAQLSDIHLGTFVGDPEMNSAVALVGSAAPDAIVLTGDLLDHDPRHAEDLARLVRRLGALAPVYAVVGNHDYYAGVGTVMRHLREAGAEVLRNRHLLLGEGHIALAGVDDLWATRFGKRLGPDLDAALKHVPDDVARVLLAHQPAFFAEASPHVDLQLSGHTHGGQVNFGVRPADVVLPYGWVAGRYRRDDAQLWVNRGFGTAGPPARLGAAPEVTKIVLHS